MAPINALDTAGSPQASDDERWEQLLDGLDVQHLTEVFLDRVLKVSDYSKALIPVSEIRRTGAASFIALIDSLRRGADPIDAEHLRFEQAADVGVSRARANIPIESLMTAIRLDFSILWAELTGLAEARDAALLVHRAEQVWLVVDSYASQTQAAYAAERQRMLHEASSIRQGYVAGIFGQEQPGPDMFARIAGEIGIDIDATLGVAVALGEAAPALRVAIALAGRTGVEPLTHPLADGLVAFWLADERPGSAGGQTVAAMRKLRCGLVERTEGLVSLASAARFARELAGLLEDGDAEALTLERSWTRIARLRLADAGMPVAIDIDKALASCGRAERDRLTAAVQAYLATGSIAESAQRLFCHRNTLMNRLRRFAEVTGVDPTVPQQSARLVVAWS